MARVVETLEQTEAWKILVSSHKNNGATMFWSFLEYMSSNGNLIESQRDPKIPDSRAKMASKSC